jgi:hypothetical protein
MVTVVMPRSGRETAAREAVRAYVADRYRRLHPEWALVHAEAPGARFSKGAAVNPHLTGDGVLIVADADSYTDPRALTQAVEAVEAGVAAWAVPFTVVKRIGKESTALVLSGATVARPRIERAARALPGGGIVVASAEAWATVNGYDPRFRGWGGEDAAVGTALRLLVGPALTPTMPTTLWHLWHPATRRVAPANRALWDRWRAARRDPAAAAALTAEWEGPRQCLSS